jgi:hypothetical protein
LAYYPNPCYLDDKGRFLIWGNPLSRSVWRVLKQRIVLKPVVSVSLVLSAVEGNHLSKGLGLLRFDEA